MAAGASIEHTQTKSNPNLTMARIHHITLTTDTMQTVEMHTLLTTAHITEWTITRSIRRNTTTATRTLARGKANTATAETAAMITQMGGEEAVAVSGRTTASINHRAIHTMKAGGRNNSSLRTGMGLHMDPMACGLQRPTR